MFTIHTYRNPRYLQGAELLGKRKLPGDTAASLKLGKYPDRATAERKANQINRNNILTSHVYVRKV